MGKYEVASKNKRIIAAMIDMCIGIAFFGIILGILIEIMNRIALIEGPAAMLISVLIMLVILPVYYAILDCSIRGVGKYVMKICVRKTSGNVISFSTGIKRGFLKTVSMPIILVPLIYLLNKQDSMFYDRLLDTNVYNIK